MTRLRLVRTPEQEAKHALRDLGLTVEVEEPDNDIRLTRSDSAVAYLGTDDGQTWSFSYSEFDPAREPGTDAAATLSADGTLTEVLPTIRAWAVNHPAS